MAFDPANPVEDSPLGAAEMRNQFAVLKALIDDLQQEFAPLVPVLNRFTSVATISREWPNPISSNYRSAGQWTWF